MSITPGEFIKIIILIAVCIVLPTYCSLQEEARINKMCSEIDCEELYLQLKNID